MNGTQSCGGNKVGKERIVFKDGTNYSITAFPTLSSEGLCSSTPFQVFYEKFIINDDTNNLCAEVEFNPKYDNSYLGIASNFGMGAAKGAGSLMKSGLGKLWGSSKKKEEKKEEAVKEDRGDQFVITIKK